MDAREGVLIECVNPTNGQSTFPSMNNCIRLIPGNFKGEARCTENIDFVTVEGSATFHLPDGHEFKVQPFEVTAIPSWVPYSITNSGNTPAVLFSNSDRPPFEKLGFYRQAPGKGRRRSGGGRFLTRCKQIRRTRRRFCFRGLLCPPALRTRYHPPSDRVAETS